MAKPVSSTSVTAGGGPSTLKASCSYTRPQEHKHIHSCEKKTWFCYDAACLEEEMDDNSGFKNDDTSVVEDGDTKDADTNASREILWQATQNPCGPLQRLLSIDTQDSSEDSIRYNSKGWFAASDSSARTSRSCKRRLTYGCNQDTEETVQKSEQPSIPLSTQSSSTGTMLSPKIDLNVPPDSPIIMALIQRIAEKVEERTLERIREKETEKYSRIRKRKERNLEECVTQMAAPDLGLKKRIVQGLAGKDASDVFEDGSSQHYPSTPSILSRHESRGNLSLSSSASILHRKAPEDRVSKAPTFEHKKLDNNLSTPTSSTAPTQLISGSSISSLSNNDSRTSPAKDFTSDILLSASSNTSPKVIPPSSRITVPYCDGLTPEKQYPSILNDSTSPILFPTSEAYPNSEARRRAKPIVIPNSHRYNGGQVGGPPALGMRRLINSQNTTVSASGISGPLPTKTKQFKPPLARMPGKVGLGPSNSNLEAANKMRVEKSNSQCSSSTDSPVSESSKSSRSKISTSTSIDSALSMAKLDSPISSALSHSKSTETENSSEDPMSKKVSESYSAYSHPKEDNNGCTRSRRNSLQSSSSPGEGDVSFSSTDFDMGIDEEELEKICRAYD